MQDLFLIFSLKNFIVWNFTLEPEKHLELLFGYHWVIDWGLLFCLFLSLFANECQVVLPFFVEKTVLFLSNCLCILSKINWACLCRYISRLYPVLLIMCLKVKVKVTPLCLTLCDPMDNTVHGMLQARILEWVAYPFSSISSRPRNRTRVSCIAGGFFTNWAIREAPILCLSLTSATLSYSMSWASQVAQW